MRSFIHLIALLTLGFALQPAAAQSVQPSNTANPWKTEVVAAAAQTARGANRSSTRLPAGPCCPWLFPN